MQGQTKNITSEIRKKRFEKRQNYNVCKHSMDYIKQKHCKLSHIIKNCKTTEVQLVELKRKLESESKFDPLNRYRTKIVKSVSLLKNSRLHIEQFEKRQAKMASLKFKQDISQKNQILGTQNGRKQMQGKSKKYKKIVEGLKNHQTQSIREDQPAYHNNSEPVTPENSKQKDSHENYLPNIQSAYVQTFSPKNASMSQYTLAVRQLQRSAHKKQHEERCKKYNKENIMRQYDNRRQKEGDKLEMHRLSILKKISCENVKKYLMNKAHIQERNAVVERQQKALYRSYHERC